MICRLFCFFSCFLFLFQPSFAMERLLAHQFLDGLLQRGLYESALHFCDSELQKAKGVTEQAAEANFFAAEKVRVLTLRAVSLAETEREPAIGQLEEWTLQWEKSPSAGS